MVITRAREGAKLHVQRQLAEILVGARSDDFVDKKENKEALHLMVEPEHDEPEDHLLALDETLLGNRARSMDLIIELCWQVIGKENQDE